MRVPGSGISVSGRLKIDLARLAGAVLVRRDRGPWAGLTWPGDQTGSAAVAVGVLERDGFESGGEAEK
jgi:hypothetical protein